MNYQRELKRLLKEDGAEYIRETGNSHARWRLSNGQYLTIPRENSSHTKDSAWRNAYRDFIRTSKLNGSKPVLSGCSYQENPLPPKAAVSIKQEKSNTHPQLMNPQPDPPKQKEEVMEAVAQLPKEPLTKSKLIDTYIKVITPEVAQEMIDKNHSNNRNIKPANLARVVKDLKDGKFEENGESITVHVDGTLLDGQHRLHAVIKTGISIRTVVSVVDGPPMSIINTTGTGQRRSGADYLQGCGYKNATTLNAAIALLDKYMSDSILKNGPSPTNREINDILETYPDLPDSVEWACKSASCQDLFKGSVTSFCHYMLGKYSIEDRDTFFELLDSGAEMESDHPIMVLRKKFIRIRMQSTQRKAKKDAFVRQSQTVAFIFKTWNAFRKNNKLSVIRWSNKDKFPVPI